MIVSLGGCNRVQAVAAAFIFYAVAGWKIRLNWRRLTKDIAPLSSLFFCSPPTMVPLFDSSIVNIAPLGYIRPQFINDFVAICVVPSAGRLIVDTFCMMSPSFVLLLFPVHKCA